MRAEAAADACLSRQVEDHVDPLQQSRQVVAGQVELGEAERRLAAQPLEVALLDRARVVGGEAVHPYDRGSAVDEPLAQVRAHETRASGDEGASDRLEA